MLPHAVSVGGGEGSGVVVEARVSYQLKSLIMSEFHSPKKKKKRAERRLLQLQLWFHSGGVWMKGDSDHRWSAASSVTHRINAPATRTHAHTHTVKCVHP